MESKENKQTNNKKIFVLGGIAILVLLIGGYLLQSRNSRFAADKSDNNSKTVFTSIKDALSKDITLTCDFKDDSGVSTKSYIKNGSVRISSTGQTQAGEVIIKNKKMYMWDSKTKQGFVYDIPEEEANTQNDQSQNYLTMIDKYKDFCKVASVENSYFEEPKDVKFQDMSKLLEDLKEQMSKAPVPTQ